ncbi:hypothetical protein [Algoriphagus sp. A40]|uniref:hypothetical protein n=1 Tax=Algoriphagus sp. A40 TaxID=1945863 RepID=UPI0009861E6C|nr:hypothetical protein [Algoriphagus sp. A40]OOG72766.1 hypothetical protein B0E43_14995 [Algoriphagus sp. A40]
MKIGLTLVLFLSLIFGALAQSTDFILLKRGRNQKTQIRFYPGEEITYKSKKLGYFVTDQIVNVDKDFIYLTENILSPSDILEVDVRNKDPRNRTMRNLTALFLGAGGILLTVEAINSLYQQDQLKIDEGVAITSGILIGTGLALLPLRYKTFKNTTGFGIQIILMRME